MPIGRPRFLRVQTSLATRLTLAFVGVTLLGVLLVTGIAMLLGNHGFDRMVAERRADLAQSLRANAEATYVAGGPGWARRDLQPALALAAGYGTEFALLDAAGDVVASTAGDPARWRGAERFPLVVGTKDVGTLVMRYPDGLGKSVAELRASLIAAVIGAGCLAALLAAFVALAVSRRETAPLKRLLDATEAMGRGVTGVRVGPVNRRAPRELRDLAATFDAMADTLVRQEQLRRDLVADVAHELRTPVAILQAHLEALSDGVVPYSPHEVHSLHEEVIRLGERVGDLEALARADAAAVSLLLQSCDLAQLTAVAVDQMRARTEVSGIVVTSDLVPTVVYADPGRLHQVVTNLLVNAVKFTPPAGRVHVSVDGTDAGGRLVVRDTGIGIAPHELALVFDRFWRSAHVTHIAGSGIGLTIVAQLVGAHGGTVHIDSAIGEGTAVSVVLPQTARPARAPETDPWRQTAGS
jgi:two-component system sensor histidine kinase BaeS